MSMQLKAFPRFSLVTAPGFQTTRIILRQGWQEIQGVVSGMTASSLGNSCSGFITIDFAVSFELGEY